MVCLFFQLLSHFIIIINTNVVIFQTSFVQKCFCQLGIRTRWQSIQFNFFFHTNLPFLHLFSANKLMSYVSNIPLKINLYQIATVKFKQMTLILIVPYFILISILHLFWVQSQASAPWQNILQYSPEKLTL